ncbi:adenine phosphoribosyltransferase [Croceifilum oryzae]|uniref:Adenine phosphoribosyltransferase n=1 Tax=Croceifilum oryzae TaxID=1553429 RepID=A0AAJ1WRV9_9BACL|nr:adenine phosphoribosyltransferase [Croceifilum oryzae]MDQ0416995.1 adenine phosphoribosyltransferase [Croceifilum oryzae]
MNLKEKIRVIPDFPSEGIRFKDITTLLKDGEAYRAAIEELAKHYKGMEIDLVLGPEARGFVVGAPLALALGAGFVPVRKKGKLPGEIIEAKYDLEYGKDILTMHKDAIQPGQKVLIADDLLATGGTISATLDLVRQLGGEPVGIAFWIELMYLNGREKLGDIAVHSLIKYD